MDTPVSAETSSRQRKRGVRVSVTKLRAAMVTAGVHTQAELAERLADQQGSDSPPKGTVQRMLRGQAVDPMSLERVARVLGVEAWTLYLSAEEAAQTETGENPAASASSAPDILPVTPAPARNPKRPLVWLALGLPLLLGLGWRLWPEPVLPAGPESLVLAGRVTSVLPFAGDEAGLLGSSLDKAVARQVPQLAGAAASAGKSGAEAIKAALQGGADQVLTGEIKRVGQHWGVHLFLHDADHSRRLWSGMLPAFASAQRLETHWQQVLQGLLTTPAAEPLPLEALEHQLNGRLYLGKHRSERNILKALAEAEAALKRAPDSAEGQAVLCEALVQDSARTGDLKRLDDAAPHCQRAMTLAPELPESWLGLAAVARRKGQRDEAETHYREALKREPHQIAAMLGLAELLIQRFTKGDSGLTPADLWAPLDQALAVSPEDWKVHHTRARLAHFLGDRKAALLSQAEAARLDANFSSLANLGTYAFCEGEFRQARDAWQRSADLGPEEYVGDMQVGVAHYFLSEFEAAIPYMERSRDALLAGGKPAQYEIWGNLADAYRHAGRKAEAIRHYEEALQHVEQAVAKGDGNGLHRAHRLYFHLMLAKVAPERLTPVLKRSLSEEAKALDGIQNPAAQTQLAFSWLALGERAKAARLREQVSAQCVGYGLSPDFQELGSPSAKTPAP